MFILINNISEGTTSTIKLFADDCILLRVIRSACDVSALQHDLNKLCDWAKTWQMSFNAGKCSVLTVTKKMTPLLSVYSMLGQTLQHFDHHPYLGVELARDMCWGPHIKKDCSEGPKLPLHAAQEPTWVLRDNKGPRLHHHGQTYPGVCKYCLGPLPQYSYQAPGGCPA